LSARPEQQHSGAIGFDRSRLRSGEVIAGVAAVVLLASVFLLPWYGLTGTIAPVAARLGVSTSVNGWQSLTSVRWLMLVTILAALTLVYLQGTRRAPALPASFSLIVMLLGGLTALALIYRVLINVPGTSGVIDHRVGGLIGLISGCAIAYGGYRSLREEGIAPRDEPAEIPAVAPGSQPPS
jgi:hypothetical protein